MDIKHDIKTLLQEAEIYRAQGLLVEAKNKYKDVAAILEKNTRIKNRQHLIDGINNKIKSLDKDLVDFVKAPEKVEVPREIQDLIKKQFVFTREKDENIADLEGAIALAKFGQDERALQDLKELLSRNAVRLPAAKNILRCHIANKRIDEAVAQYEEWFSGDLFTPAQKKNICKFLEDALAKKNIIKPLSQIAESSTIRVEIPEKISEVEDEEELIDISSVTIQFEDGPKKGEAIEFDVNFQSGNVISILFSRKEQTLVESFKVGLTLKNVQFLSPIALFTGTGVVTDKTEISSGPRKGDYSLDIKIVSTH